MPESSERSADQFSVERIASLAKLAPENGAEIGDQLQRMLQFVAILDELQLDDVQPFFGASDLRSNLTDQPIRSDQSIVKSLPRDQVLKNAAQQDDEFYVVPPVFE